MENIFETLKTQSYAQLPFPMNRETLEDAVKAFFRFLEEPDSVRNHIDFTIAPQHRRGDVGFKHRNSDDHMYNDNKDFFHFHPAIFKQYEAFLKEHPVVNDFVTKALPIWDLTSKTVHQILKSLESKFPNLASKVFDTKHVHILLRFLKYEWHESGKNLAKPHFDAGSFTLAIAESCPGLRIGSCPENLQLVTHQDEHAIFMLSSNYKTVIDTDDLKPGWHDVIQIDETVIGSPLSRWAIVAFIDAHGVKALSRSETHKWHTEAAA